MNKKPGSRMAMVFWAGKWGQENGGRKISIIPAPIFLPERKQQSNEFKITTSEFPG